MALNDDMMFATRKYRAPYGLEESELRQKGKKLNAAGPLYVSLTEYKTADPTTPSPLFVGTPGDRRNRPVENRFTGALERKQPESREAESMDETLKEAGEEKELGNTPDGGATNREFSPGTTRELLQALSGDDWQTSPPQLWYLPGRILSCH